MQWRMHHELGKQFSNDPQRNQITACNVILFCTSTCYRYGKSELAARQMSADGTREGVEVVI